MPKRWKRRRASRARRDVPEKHKNGVAGTGRPARGGRPDMAQTTPAAAGRTERDRLKAGGTLRKLTRRPEVGAFAVMMLVILAIAFSSNGNAFNPLGLKNNLSVISQFGIIATAAC